MTDADTLCRSTSKRITTTAFHLKDYARSSRERTHAKKELKNMSYQMTIFDVLKEQTPDWRDMSLKQIAAYISEKTGLNFIPDTRFKGEFNEYIAYKTSKLFFTLGLGNYNTLDERNGVSFISVGYENKKDLSGGGAPCDSLDEAIEYFNYRIRRTAING